MKKLLYALTIALASIALIPDEATAGRLGRGGGAGMQRSLPSRTPPAAVPAKPAPAAPAATPGRSWMGPIAGLAAGLGLAALMSHLGMGAEFANFLTIALLAVVAIVAIRFLMRRFGPAAASPAPAMAGTGTTQFAGSSGPAWSPGQSIGASPASEGLRPASASGVTPGAFAAALPADFDAAGFARIAKMIFIRMQAANDAADLNDLRAFTTPEMFASFKLDLQDRAGMPQQTDVVTVDAEVLDVSTEADRQIVSVRFHGLIREQKDAGALPFDEVWHLVRPVDGSREWAIAGIQQVA